MTDWTTPRTVESLDLTFGTRATTDFMPSMAEIPDEFKSFNCRCRWCSLQSDWFFYGLKDVTWTPREGIDQTTAVRHLASIQGSWEPSHEHKAAAVAYLASLWFEDVVYSRAKKSVS